MSGHIGADDEAYPEALRSEEEKFFRQRWGQDAVDRVINPAPDFPGVGVALSGGGIRSATFCLGVFRALARADLIRRIDFLSTVSGGGYFGAFLGGLFTPPEGRPGQRPQQPPKRASTVTNDLLDLRSNPISWLRENGRYMSPNGAGDTLLMGAMILRNLIAIQVVIITGLLTAMSAAILVGNAYANEWRRLTQTAPPLQEIVALSPWFAPAVVILAALVVPLAWAFWFTQPGWPWARWHRGLTPFVTIPVIVAIVAKTLDIRWTILVVTEATLAITWWVVARRRAVREYTDGNVDFQRSRLRLERNDLSRWLSNALTAAIALTLFAIADGLGQLLTVTAPDRFVSALISAGSAIVSVSAILQSSRSFLGALAKPTRFSVPARLVVGIVAGLVVIAIVVSVSALAHYVDNWVPWNNATLWLFLGSAAFAFAFARTLPFLNVSSHNALYGGRLTRAYLGASNPKRVDGGATITETIPGDAISMASYEPYAYAGPLHLINVTLNETVSGKSQIEQRDRKGLNMAIGPAGVSVGRRHHATWANETRSALRGLSTSSATRGEYAIFPATGKDFEVHELDLGDWISISGAAFTTGLGSRTSLPLSILLGLSNVRLGYWWDSGVDPGIRTIEHKDADTRNSPRPVESPKVRRFRKLAQAFPVYAYLFDELLARFHGPARQRWYLSDGGHSENTGAYELLRRRVPFIVLCDNGCDRDFRFEDLGNLVRRVRTDFNAEIAFYSQEQLEELLPAKLLPHFGLPAYFEPGEMRHQHAACHALLAGVFYDDPNRQKSDPDSVLLILKPSICGDEPLDVLEYKRAHPAFPHESTIDQYFDEAQWESYRRLGEHVASVVFETIGVGSSGWSPGQFVKPPKTKEPWARTRPAQPVPPRAVSASSLVIPQDSIEGV